MPFDQAPPQRPRKQNRPSVSASALKVAIVDAALAGIITAREAEDLIAELRLRHE